MFKHQYTQLQCEFFTQAQTAEHIIPTVDLSVAKCA